MKKAFLNKNICWGILTLLFVFLAGCSSILALENATEASPEAVAKKYSLVFPIAELGGCNSLDECKTFCADETNKEACTDFAKKKGLRKEKEATPSGAVARAKKMNFLIAAKAALGCDSEEACKVLCSNKENFGKCVEFAKKQNLVKPKEPKPLPEGVLEKAKQLLGCDSPDSCRTFCDNPANAQKCAEFAKNVLSQVGMMPKKEMDKKATGSSLMKLPAQMNMEACKQNPEKCKPMLDPQNSATKSGTSSAFNTLPLKEVQGVNTQLSFFSRILAFFGF